MFLKRDICHARFLEFASSSLKMFTKRLNQKRYARETHRRWQFNPENKNRLKHNMKTVLIAFLKKQRYPKIKCLTLFRNNCNEDFIFWDLNKRDFFVTVFSLIWAHSLGVQTGLPAFKTLWISPDYMKLSTVIHNTLIN